MRLFGRKANGQQAARTDVPPELQPYFNSEARTPRARLVLKIVLPVLLVVLVAGTGTGLWLHARSTPAKHTAPPAASQSATSQPETTSPTPPSSTPLTGTDNGQSSADVTTPPGQTGQSSNQSQPGADSTPAVTPPAAASAIPNTGPGQSMLLAIAAGLIATTLYHIRQRRHVRS